MSGHYSVLYRECMEALPAGRRPHFCGRTLGGGGHSEGFCKTPSDSSSPLTKIRRPSSGARSGWSPYAGRFTLVHDDFQNIKGHPGPLGCEGRGWGAAGSGRQLFSAGRRRARVFLSKRSAAGYAHGQGQPPTAQTIVNTYEKRELIRIISTHGEEKFAARIADRILKNRPIMTTTQLAEIVREAIPQRHAGQAAIRRSGRFRRSGLRVNGELDHLSETTRDFIDILAPGGILAVITFPWRTGQ